MVGTGARFFFTLGVLTLLGAAAYGLASGGDPIGVISVGYKGGVGEHFGYAVLLGTSVTSFALGVFAVVLRDVDPTPATLGADAVPEVEAPRTASPWPLVGAFGVVITALGLVLGSGFVVLGLVVLAVTVVEWAVQAWSDRATGDPAVNMAIRNRLMAPVEIPVGAVLVIGFLALGISRVFLAVSKEGAVGVAAVALVLIVLGAVLVLRRGPHSATIATVMVLVVALAVVAGGIAGIAAGEREFEHHGEHGAEAEG